MNRRLRLALQLLSVLLFGFILWWAGPETLKVVLQGDWRTLLLSLFLHGVAGVASASRLYFMAQAVSGGKVISWRRTYYLNWTARALGLVLPRSISTLGGKAVALKTVGLPVRQAVWAVMLDNLFDLFWLGLVAIPAFFWLQGRLETAVFWLSMPGLALVAILATAWAAKHGRLNPLLTRVRRIPWLAERLKLDSVSTERLIPPPVYALPALVSTIILHTVLIFSFYAIGLAIHTPGEVTLFGSSYPFVQLSLIIAVAPGGLGVFDLSWLGLLRLGGVPQADALAYVVAQRAYVLVFVLFWAAFSALVSLTAEPLPTADGTQ